MSSSSDIMQVGGNAGARLKSFVERITRVQDEVKELNTDIKEIYSEAKSVGFDTKILRKVVKRYQMDAEKRQEEDDLIETYETALNNLNDMME